MGFFFPRPDIVTKPDARTGVMAYSPNDVAFILFGGQGAADQLDDTWTFNGTVWEQKSPVFTPNKRRGHAMSAGLPSVGIPNPAVTIVGGYYNDGGDNWLIDVIQWNGTNWVNQTVQGTPPSVREFHTMVYDFNQGRYVIMCGQNVTGALSDVHFLRQHETMTLEWFSPSPSGTPPSQRYGHGAAYDKINGETILFGGESSPGSYLGDTFSFQGTAWTTETPASPPSARSFHRMEWDPILEKVVLWGGKNGGGNLQDAFYWDKPPMAEDGEWVPITLNGTLPSGRSDYAIALDTDREQLFLFGGDGSLLDDTWGFVPGAVDANSLNLPLPLNPADAATIFKAEAGYWVPPS